MPQGSAAQRSAAQRSTAERSGVLMSAVRRRASDDCDALLYAVLEDPRAVEQFAATKEQHVKFIKDNEVKRGKFWTDPRFERQLQEFWRPPRSTWICRRSRSLSSSSGQDRWPGASAAHVVKTSSIDKILPAEQVMKFTESEVLRRDYQVR